MTFWEDN